MVTVVEDPDATLLAPVVTVDVTVEIAPGFTVICGLVLVTAEPPIVALIFVAVPDEVPVNTAV